MHISITIYICIVILTILKKKQQHYKQAIEQEMQFKPSINKNVGITSNGQEARNNIVELKLLLHILWQFL